MNAIACKLLSLIAGAMLASVCSANDADSANDANSIPASARSAKPANAVDSYQRLLNLKRYGAREDACLQATADSKLVIANCNSTPDDVRRRMWKVVQLGSYFMIQNQYALENGGYPACVKWDANGKAVVLAQCPANVAEGIQNNSVWYKNDLVYSQNIASLTSCIWAKDGNGTPWSDFCPRNLNSDDRIGWFLRP